MADDTDRERGAQEENPGQRERKQALSKQQDFERPKEGRDEAPSEPIAKGRRSKNSPWMGGG